MSEGDTSTGGAQVNPSNISSPTPTPQPDTKPTSDTEAASILTISHEDHPSTPTPQPAAMQPIAPPVTPTQPIASPVTPAQPVSSPITPTASTQPAQEVTPATPTAIFSQPTPLPAQPAGQPSTQAASPVIATAPTFTSQVPQPNPSPQPLASSLFPPQQSTQFPVQTLSSDNGDIVLNSPTPQKSKKGLIIGLIIFALISIVIGIVVLILQGSTSKESSNINQADLEASSFEAYKRYANHLLNGTDSDEDIDSSISWKKQNMIITVMVFYNLEDRLTYVDKMQNLYSNFQELFDKIELEKLYNEDSTLVKNLYENINVGVNSLANYMRSGSLTLSDFIQSYLVNGADGVRTLLKETYGDMDNLGDSLYDRFVKSKQAEAEAFILLYDYVSNIGCIANGSLDDACAELYSSDPTVSSLAEDVDIASSESEALESHITSDLVSSSNDLYEILRGEENAQEE